MLIAVVESENGRDYRIGFRANPEKGPSQLTLFPIGAFKVDLGRSGTVLGHPEHVCAASL